MYVRNPQLASIETTVQPVAQLGDLGALSLPKLPANMDPNTAALLALAGGAALGWMAHGVVNSISRGVRSARSKQRRAFRKAKDTITEHNTPTWLVVLLLAGVGLGTYYFVQARTAKQA